MEKHFLAELVKDEGPATFQAEPWYNAVGDCIIYQMVDEPFVARRVDELLTVYDAVEGGRTIGFQVKGVRGILQKFGLDGLSVESGADSNGVQSVSITALLLAAYEDGVQSLGRRQAYAAVMECPAEPRTIRLDELQTA